MECLAQRPDEQHKQQEEASCEQGEEIQASVSIPSGDALECVTKSSNNIPQHASETDTDAQMETIVQPLTNNVIGNAGPDTLLRVEQFSLVMQQQDQYQQQQQQKHHRDSHNHQPRQTNCCPSPLQRPIATQYLDDDQQHLNCYPHQSNAEDTGSTHIHQVTENFKSSAGGFFRAIGRCSACIRLGLYQQLHAQTQSRCATHTTDSSWQRMTNGHASMVDWLIRLVFQDDDVLQSARMR
ncbi:hypothetical protein B0O80DRAFT_425856 [Mortierella sp. GBAus27b]|nr:hypothetical protein B0O80DRAFT_425856 [Mortierella sp. GBAus27b]